MQGYGQAGTKERPCTLGGQGKGQTERIGALDGLEKTEADG